MKLIKHFITITRHRHKVIAICFKIGIGFQGLFHDLSKYSFSEFFVGAKYYQGNRSPNVVEREVKGYSSAWLHHKGRNKHHVEYWSDINPLTDQYEPVKMPLKYLKEMFADRIAATKIYKGKKYKPSDVMAYYLSRESQLKMHKDTSTALELFMQMLIDKGEKETFKFVKKFKEEDYGKNRS